MNPDCTLSIRSERGEDLPGGEPGRRWIKSPCIMRGYWGSPESTHTAIRDGWLDTSDLVQAHADGYLWFSGRREQIILHDGSTICPQEVEQALLEHPAVDRAGVVGVHDLVHGENVRACVLLDEMPLTAS